MATMGLFRALSFDTVTSDTHGGGRLSWVGLSSCLEQSTPEAMTHLHREQKLRCMLF